MNELFPLILLFLFGGFAVVSAVLKSRAKVTALFGVVLAVLEAISGIALMAAAFPSSGSLDSASRMGIVTALMVALSSTVHLMKVRERNRARDESEGRRLYAAVKYGLGGGRADGPGDQGVEGRTDQGVFGLSDQTLPDSELDVNGDAAGEGDSAVSD